MADLCTHKAVEEGEGLASQPVVVRIVDKWKESGPIVKEAARLGVIARGLGRTRALQVIFMRLPGRGGGRDHDIAC